MIKIFLEVELVQVKKPIQTLKIVYLSLCIFRDIKCNMKSPEGSTNKRNDNDRICYCLFSS